jgi:hypothetical protein
MASRKARRKTISHAELEGFLGDLGDEENVPKNLANESDMSIRKELKHSSVDADSDEQDVREIFKVRNKYTAVFSKYARIRLIEFHLIVHHEICFFVNHS